MDEVTSKITDDSLYIADLIIRSFTDTLQPGQQEELQTWVSRSARNARFYELVMQESYGELELDEFDELEQSCETSLQRVLPEMFPRTNRRSLYRYLSRAAVAAAAAVVVLTMIIIVRNWPSSTPQQTATPQETQLAGLNIPAGRHRATLQLSDGRIIKLDSSSNNQLAVENETVIGQKNGALTYTASNPGAQYPAKYNTVLTDKGETYVVQLSEDTRVWLNSQSSIHYPVNFNGNDRTVEIKGEAYLEVTKNANWPFVVNILHAKTNQPKSIITVLGTSFNINAYEDEPDIKTTLLEGSIRIKSTGPDAEEQLLKPGYQAAQEGNNIQIRYLGEDTAAIIAWKDEVFNFNNKDLEAIMRQLARWYNIEVSYEGNIPRKKFIGEISIYSHLDKVLQVLETTKTVRFRYTGNKVIVQPW